MGRKNSEKSLGEVTVQSLDIILKSGCSTDIRRVNRILDGDI